ncbi:MAG TPA: hypothetical protein VHZ31_09240 [Solirubrobacteraceae bacterium]|jgi:hypothetical protein|nr:hypothetical protein [Solirubrobacteraceae bacterium]
MAGIDSLTDQQRAILQLLLKQGKSYEEIAALLRSDTSSVQARAHESVAALGPGRPDIGADRRREVADYLLGQQIASRRAATLEYLDDSADGRGWARAVASALRPIGGSAVAEVPAEPAEPTIPVDAAEGARPGRGAAGKGSSQLGNRLFVGALGVLVAIALILIFHIYPKSSNDDKVATTTVTRTAPGVPKETPQVIATATLRPPKGAKSPWSGEAGIIRYQSNNQFKLIVAGKKLPAAPANTSYAIWLYTSASDAMFVGFPKASVTATGGLQVAAPLSPDTRTYNEVLITRESVEKPDKPGKIFLRGQLIVPKAKSTGQTATQPPTTTAP